MSFHPQMEYAPARFHKSERKLADPGEAFRYTAENQAKFDENVQRYPAEQRKSAILYALYLAQGQQGYLTGNAMRFVAQQIVCSKADVEDVVSDGTNRPWRVKMRPPSFMAIQALPSIVQGGLIADVVAVIGSNDVVMGDCDR